MRAAVLGAGVMGRNIAKVLLRGGSEVSLFSRTEQTLLDAGRALEREGADRIGYTTSIAEASRDAQLVIESVPESAKTVTAAAMASSDPVASEIASAPSPP